MFECFFSNELNGRNVDATASLLVQPRLFIPKGDYPGHGEWVLKAMTEVEEGGKISMVAWLNRQRAGVAVYQRHREIPTRLEIKNLSVERFAQGRHVASFLLHNVEIEGLADFPGCVEAGFDTKITNTDIIDFAVAHGYTIEEIRELDANFGHNRVPDVVMSKPLAGRSLGGGVALL